MSALSDAIAEVYAQVAAPPWAAPNLDALTDVLRDLSWLAPGPVPVRIPPHPGATTEDGQALRRALDRAERDSAGGARPVLVRRPDRPDG